jgi:hypothetical protein
MSETLNQANADRDIYTMRKTSKNGVFTVGNEQTDPAPVTRNGVTSQSFRIGGTPHINARQLAIAALYAADERDAAETQAGVLSDLGSKLTVLRIDSAGYVQVVEGTGLMYEGRPMLKSKGSSTRGHYIEGFGIVAVAIGYGKGQPLVDEYNYRAVIVPAVGYATLEGIPEYEENDDDSDIAAVFLMTSYDFGHGAAAGCLFLATDIDSGDKAETTVVNGFFWAPNGVDAVSEHGSFAFRDLDAMSGRVRDYKPGALTFAGVMNDQLGTWRSEAYAVLAASQQ